MWFIEFLCWIFFGILGVFTSLLVIVAALCICAIAMLLLTVACAPLIKWVINIIEKLEELFL